MGVILATLSALIYGCADFSGGKATRRASAATVTFCSQLTGLTVLAVAVLLVPSAGPSARVLMFGALGGLGGALGLLLLYHGLAVGTMSIVSPVTAVTAAVIPVVFGTTFLGERPGATAVAGVVFALVAIALVSLNPGGDDRASRPLRLIGIAMGAGLGFGAFFVLLQQAGDPRDIGLWALVGARPVSITVAGLLARRQGHPLVPPRGVLPLVVGAGAMDQLANVLYVLSLSHGLLSLLAVLASLYPLSTVALARVIDGERLRRVQVLGLVCAASGLVLIAG